MARGLGATYKTNKCNCEDPKWSCVATRIVRSGKQIGKKYYTIYCSSCNNQWETAAKYAEKLFKDTKR